MSERIKLPYLSDENWERIESSLSEYGSLSQVIQGQRDSPFDLNTIIPDLESSYKENGYQYLFFGLVRLLKPQKIIEIGVLQGFSLLSMACGLKGNGSGSVIGYDLFDEYQFKNDRMTNVLSRITNSGLQEFASVRRCDAFEVFDKAENADFLHIDISNNGDIIEKLFHSWVNKTPFILLEGGGIERDNVPWMIKYNKKRLIPTINDLSKAFDSWSFLTLEAFPSITLCINQK